MVITNVIVDGKKKDIIIRDGIIEKIVEHKSIFNDEIINGDGKYAHPGLIDIHIHGCMGVDMTDGSADTLKIVSEYLARNGVTSFLSTFHTDSEEQIKRAAQNVSEYINAGKSRVHLLGIYLEGIYFSTEYKGAQNQEFLGEPDIEQLKRLNNAADRHIKIVSCAPELNGALDFIEYCNSQNIKVAVGHTGADYETGIKAIHAGAGIATHLFNGMAPISHRNPSLAVAVLEKEIYAELICDLHHVHPAIIRMAVQLLKDKAILISDNTYIAGLPDGSYYLNRKRISVKNGIAVTDNGNLAGNTVSLLECVKRAVEIGISKKQAIEMATINPARFLGMSQRKGSIDIGMDADIIITDDYLNVYYTIVAGKCVYAR